MKRTSELELRNVNGGAYYVYCTKCGFAKRQVFSTKVAVTAYYLLHTHGKSGGCVAFW